MDNKSEIEEIINEVFISVKELFSFCGISDSNIYKLIKKSVDKNRRVTKEDLLVKTIKCCSKELINEIHDNKYESFDIFFEQEFSCFDNYDGLVRLDFLLSGVSGKNSRDLYIKLFKRYDVFSSFIINILEVNDYSFSKIKKNILDKRVQKIMKIYCEFIVENKNEIDDSEYDVGFDNCDDMELLNDYYLNNDKEALGKYIELNMGLVTGIAIKYRGLGVSYDDLVQEGLIGFLKAIDKYNPKSKAKLSSYAYTSILRHVTRAVNNDSRSIRIPHWRCEELKKYIKVKQEYINSYGVEPTLEEMASLLNISLDMVEESEVLSTNYVCSLNLKVDSESDTEFGELLEDNECLSPEDYVIESFMRDDINFVLDEVLTKQEKAVIDLSFGRYDGVVRNNAEVGIAIYEYGLRDKPLSRERVRQLRSGALKKIRESSYVKKMESYL